MLYNVFTNELRFYGKLFFFATWFSNIVISGSLQWAAYKQRRSSKAPTNDSHALPWASVGNICESLPVYLLVMLLLIDT